MAEDIISIKVNEVGGLRNKGHFTSAGLDAQRQRNRQMAQQVQERTAEIIESKIRWREETTGRLVENTLAPENATSDTWRVAVGNPSFLDRSSSKYWRTVEQGSVGLWKHPFIGTALVPRRGGREGGGKGDITGFWTSKKGRFVVRHEIQGQDAYSQAAIDTGLRDFGVASVRATIADILR